MTPNPNQPALALIHPGRLLRHALACLAAACSLLAHASPLAGSYTLHDSADAAVSSIAGTSRHVFLFFSDYNN